VRNLCGRLCLISGWPQKWRGWLREAEKMCVISEKLTVWRNGYLIQIWEKISEERRLCVKKYISYSRNMKEERRILEVKERKIWEKYYKYAVAYLREMKRSINVFRNYSTCVSDRRRNIEVMKAEAVKLEMKKSFCNERKYVWRENIREETLWKKRKPRKLFRKENLKWKKEKRSAVAVSMKMKRRK